MNPIRWTISLTYTYHPPSIILPFDRIKLRSKLSNLTCPFIRKSSSPSTMASNAKEEFVEPPAGYVAHHESTTQVLIKSASSSDQPSEAFINPVQEYNRDLSICAIRAWASIRNQEIQSRSLKAHKKRKHQKLQGGGDRSDDDQNPKKAIKLDSNCDLPNASHPHDGAEPDPQTCNNKSIQQDDFQPTNLSTTFVLSSNHQEIQESDHDHVAENQALGRSDPPAVQPRYHAPYKFTALEALSATGLRAIRYAKEIPSLKWIVANDLSPSAVKSIKANITHNRLDPPDSNQEGKVRVNQGDACDLMYSHRSPNRQFDVVDLDPYGTAAPFMDAAVQCVRDGGLLCVTCTDLAVLAGSAYPEKCFSNYGGSSMRAEYSHEYALRQVIHALATSAARYGRYIKPQLSLSIDFYVRIFVRVFNSPGEVKKCITNTALVYVCAGCSAFHFQPLGRSATRPTKSGTGSNVSYHNSQGPPIAGPHCEECEGKFHVAGPLWSGPLHDEEFADKVLEEAEPSGPALKTAERIKGMVRIAKMEIPDAPFFFTPAKLSGLFKCTSPSLVTVGSAILNSGFQLSRSHCQPGSIKTDAPRRFIYDLMKKWIESLAKKNSSSAVQNEAPVVDPKSAADQPPEKECKPDETSHNPCRNPTSVLLSKPSKFEINLDYNRQVEKALMTNLKIVRYQSNPLPNWGPKSRASKK